MESYKDEAIRAKHIAEKKMMNNDFNEARKFALKARDLYPELENISQVLSICDVHCSAHKTILGAHKDWYGILQVENFADESAVRKQYRRLALNLHPDKNRFPGAESAFKLICEANAVLSDPTKKTLFDHKVRVSMVRSAPVNPSAHLNQNLQFNKQYGVTNNVSDNFSGLNQHQEMFWTSCSNCRMKYQYPRNLMKSMMKCQHCMKSFKACDISEQGGVPSRPKSFPLSAHDVPVKPGISQPSGFQGIPVETSVSRETSEWCASKKVRLGRVDKVEVDTKDKGEDIRNHSTLHVQKEVNRDMNKKETRSLKNKNRKKGRKHLSESSDNSCETDNSSDSDMEDVSSKDTNSRPSRVQVRRSSRKRQNVTYKEGGDHDADDDEHPEDDNPNETVHPEESKDVNFDKGNGKADNISGYEADAIIIEKDSDGDSNHEKDILSYEDPEFNDFDKDRDEKCFSANQFWACYDSADGMPRFYAKVKRVSASPFELYITWLEANPTEDAHRKWKEKDLPIGCGIFRLGETERASSRLMFSHQLLCEKGNRRNSFAVYPRKRQVWALYRDWDLNWSLSPEEHREYKYEAVEILSGFDAVDGVRVCYLDKVEGFAYLFQRISTSTGSFLVGPNDLYRFSHRIPHYKMTGTEREGVPEGSFELDPAALPRNLDDLHYPGKTKLDPRAD